MHGPTRRDLLRAGVGAAALVALPRCAPPRAPAPPPDDPKALIVRLADPYCAEPPLAALAARWVTPVARFFVLTRAAAPVIDPARWALDVVGRVRHPLRLTARELAALPAVTVPATLMCAGNRRREHHARRPVRDPLLWGAGAIGNARWTGPRLADVLAAAGVDAGAAHVWLDGLDAAGFGGSIPLARVLDPGAPPVVLAIAMNGAPLPALHGAPVRAIVPGAIGARSVKWLGRIVVADEPSPNRHFRRAHRIARAPLDDLPVNAAICEATAVGGDRARIVGYAIAGAPTAEVARVEVSTDDGATWRAATLGAESAPSCWRLWAAEVALGPARRVVARAIDTTGAVQPPSTPWNPGGYLYDAWPRAHVP